MLLYHWRFIVAPRFFMAPSRRFRNEWRMQLFVNSWVHDTIFKVKGKRGRCGFLSHAMLNLKMQLSIAVVTSCSGTAPSSIKFDIHVFSLKGCGCVSNNLSIQDGLMGRSVHLSPYELVKFLFRNFSFRLEKQTNIFP